MFKALYGSKNVEKKTDFMKGRSLLSQLGGSAYGKIKETMNDCFDNEFNNKYTLPKIVVTGDENVGKSSLLEYITKCPIFPRDNRICTKCPTHIKMSRCDIEKYYVEFDGDITQITDKNKISQVVQGYMSNIAEDISTKEIVIGIEGPDVPTLELYDLPGIVNFPKENAKKTTKICKTYLNEQNVIPICVAPATITSMSNSKTIAILAEEKLQKNCILVLTKIDLVDTSIDDNVRQIVQRIIDVKKYGIPEGEDTKKLQFASTVGIINRTHDNSKSLEENEEHEKKWFDVNLIKKIGDENPKFIKELSGKLGIKNLLEVIDKYYSQFIMENWKPCIEQSLKDNIKILRSDLDNLGPSISDMPNDEYEKAISEMNGEFKKLYRDSYLVDNSYYSCVINERKYIDEITDENECDMYYKLNNIVKNLSLPKNILDSISKSIEEHFDDDNVYNLSRFDKLKENLFEYIGSNCQAYFDKNKTRLIWALCGRIDNYYIDCEFGDYSVFEKIVAKMFRALVFEPLYHEWDFEINKEDFVENEEITIKRAKCISQIDKLYIHKKKLKSIEL